MAISKTHGRTYLHSTSTFLHSGLLEYSFSFVYLLTLFPSLAPTQFPMPLPLNLRRKRRRGGAEDDVDDDDDDNDVETGKRNAVGRPGDIEIIPAADPTARETVDGLRSPSSATTSVEMTSTTTPASSSPSSSSRDGFYVEASSNLSLRRLLSVPRRQRRGQVSAFECFHSGMQILGRGFCSFADLPDDMLDHIDADKRYLKIPQVNSV